MLDAELSARVLQLINVTDSGLHSQVMIKHSLLCCSVTLSFNEPFLGSPICHSSFCYLLILLSQFVQMCGDNGAFLFESRNGSKLLCYGPYVAKTRLSSKECLLEVHSCRLLTVLAFMMNLHHSVHDILLFKLL